MTNSSDSYSDILKEYEEKILGAEEKIQALEVKLFTDLVNGLMDYIGVIQQNASLIARVDCLLSFATIAQKNNYIRPRPPCSLLPGT